MEKKLAWESAYIWTHEYAMFGLCDVATLAKRQRQKMNPSQMSLIALQKGKLYID